VKWTCPGVCAWTSVASRASRPIFPGRIITTKVNFTGAPIRRGEPMATIYSPELLTAQRELLEAARQRERNPRLYESARTKFELWGFSDRQVDAIIEGGEVKRELEILAPVDGVVLQRNVADQQYVSEGTVMFEVADLSRLWLVLEAYEEDLDWISVGDSVRFRLRGEALAHRHDGPGKHEWCARSAWQSRIAWRSRIKRHKRQQRSWPADVTRSSASSIPW
jgi:hypothetical protein